TATGTDNAGNSASANATFVYDLQKPTSTVTSPATLYITTWTTISGRANDQINGPTNPAGLAATGVAVGIKQVGGNWWNGVGFAGANPSYFAGTYVGLSSGTWSYALPVGLQNALISGNQYLIV